MIGDAKVKLVITAFLCLLIFAGCSKGEAYTVPSPVEISGETEVETSTETSPKVKLSFDDLNNFTFVIKTETDVVTVAGDNINGKSSQLHISMENEDVIYELNTKGGSKAYRRNDPEGEYVEREIEYTDVDFDALYEMLYHVGVDFGDCYRGAEYSLREEQDKCYVYDMKYDGELYTVRVDKETGLWTRLSCGDRTLVTLLEFSLKKGIIPNH